MNLSFENLSIIEVVDKLIISAQESHTSDIHLEPTPMGLRARFRIDGVLQNIFIFPNDIQSEIISRIKVLAGLPTDIHHSPQDGRFRQHLAEEDRFLDIRVSIVPTYYGQNVVLRLLEDRNNDQTLESLGFGKNEIEEITKSIKRPTGMVLVTGPTGSGKTTTLYTLIKMLSTPAVSIVTIEDPIEYAIPEVEQIPVNSKYGLSFANGLRSILRQDPDIIMVGEIRDKETASIAVNTALTGHLLLSTIHTNSASAAFPRLLDMNIEPYLLTSTVNIIIGQRLVRRLCPNCKEGCQKCNGTRYAGRISINEILVVNDEIRGAVLNKASAEILEKIAVKSDMMTIREDAHQKAQAGLTTLEEISRVIYE